MLPCAARIDYCEGDTLKKSTMAAFHPTRKMKRTICHARRWLIVTSTAVLYLQMRPLCMKEEQASAHLRGVLTDIQRKVAANVQACAVAGAAHLRRPHPRRLNKAPERSRHPFSYWNNMLLLPSCCAQYICICWCWGWQPAMRSLPFGRDRCAGEPSMSEITSWCPRVRMCLQLLAACCRSSDLGEGASDA